MIAYLIQYDYMNGQIHENIISYSNEIDRIDNINIRNNTKEFSIGLIFLQNQVFSVVFIIY